MTPTSPEEPNLNTGKSWSPWDDQDIRWGLDQNQPIERKYRMAGVMVKRVLSPEEEQKQAELKASIKRSR